MQSHALDNPALTIALALAAGMIVQALARHLRVPGIVLLLGAGILLGPDVLDLVRPDALGEALHILVGYAVAVILFEGGLSLDWRRLRREASTIRRLVVLGALVTAAGGALAARWILGWTWDNAILFGTLVIVTGPTVITPLLRRIRVRQNLETILLAEGVLIDAVGAITAVVTLEIVIGTGEAAILGFADVPLRLFFGAAAGALGGAAIGLLLRRRRLVPEGLENVFTLSLAVALFQACNSVVEESGIVAVVVAGIVVGNIRTTVQRELREFKEQLTVMLIGLLFILLAADVRHDEAVGLGLPGIAVVFVLMLAVRPLGVLLSSMGSGLKWREIAFLSWIAPRGIVAAAVASLFDTRLAEAGISGGQDMRAMVFLVIAVTVLFQGATGGLAARLLGVKRPRDRGYAILGGNSLARSMGRLLQAAGEPVVLIDANNESALEAEEEQLPVILGNALDDHVLLRADVASRRAVIGLLSNGAVNLLFARRAREEYGAPHALVGVQRGHGSLNPALVAEAGAGLLFAGEADLELWSVRIRRGLARVEPWRLEDAAASEELLEEGRLTLPPTERNALLPLTVERQGTVRPVDETSRISEGDKIFWLVYDERAGQSGAWLAERGWVRATPADDVEQGEVSAAPLPR